jgi:predicted ribonuclease YlaK
MSKKKRNVKKDRLEYSDLPRIEPYSDNQELAIKAFDEGQNLVLSGSAGTGKTYLGLALCLEEALNPATPCRDVIILRSAVATRDIGYLPGTAAEKMKVFYAPYEAAMNDMSSGSWQLALNSRLVSLESTSFIRGSTWDNTIVLVDEMQNMNFHELDSIITRLGLNSKIVFCGDYHQSDFSRHEEKEGINKFLSILRKIPAFTQITFNAEDIVRSDLVRDYIVTKEKFELG